MLLASKNRSNRNLAFAAFSILIAASARPAETDQYLTWNIELQDSAGPLNERLNTDLQIFVAHMNERARPVRTHQEMTTEFFSFVFRGMLSPRIRRWLSTSPDIDRFPGKSVSYFQYRGMSIYRRHSFPYILPMARTIRIGDVYLGIDKISHLFGFGRRYFLQYQRFRDNGAAHKEAMERVVRIGISQEKSIVGKLVDGIFSSGDLEANFQGLLLAIELASEETPFFERVDGGWKILRTLDLAPYITPGFDESYNPSHYWALRKRFVLPILRRQYCEDAHSPAVQARFALYDGYEPSLSSRLVEDHFHSKRRNPRTQQSLDALCGACGESTEEPARARRPGTAP